ncbi:MAG: S-adenosylmethionine:tRNA ribosyltransferase-isomerase, partial [Desulfovibrionaceae bacterium]|nr:S-adenosylmethionine:tRNA ribosyltransferase-isomerase [Desulfovibrionaceae bacterium]
MNNDWILQNYQFDLPESRIAQMPAAARDGSRLLVLERRSGKTVDAYFRNLPAFLEQPSLFVANNAGVIPARLAGTRQTGGKVEVVLLSPLPLMQAATDREGNTVAPVDALVRPAKTCRIRETVTLGDNFSITILGKSNFGKIAGMLRWRGSLA